MANCPPGRALQHLHSTILAGGNGMTDGQLLDAFIQTHDGAAFEALVRRHGPLVLGVCRRILGDGHDAEDAFQATFLVLVRKAITIVPRELVANWLYGVAFRTASKARAMNVKRRVKEAQVRERPTPDEHEEIFWRDLLPVVDRELQRLPDKYRTPIVLCDLEGRCRREAAAQLGWPEGTLSSRLAAGRRLLARRLTRCGLSPSALIPLMACPSAAPLPPVLLDATVRVALLVAAGKTGAAAGVSATVAFLADGVLKSMLLAKLKVAATMVLACVLASAGAVAVTSQGRHQRTPAPAIGSIARVPNAAAPRPEAAPAAAAPAAEPPPSNVAHVHVGEVWLVHWDKVLGNPHIILLPVRVACQPAIVLVTMASGAGISAATSPGATRDVAVFARAGSVRNQPTVQVRKLRRGQTATADSSATTSLKLVVVRLQRERAADEDGVETVEDRVIRIDIRAGPTLDVLVRTRPVG